ncbi:MAG: ATP-binding cassette domain-containing protein [Candidatus Muiribacteriota bacterium]
MIKIINLVRDYDKFRAVDNINLEIFDNEFFTLLGPNGAGKTTIINMLIGLAKITSGEILYDGKSFKENTKNFQKFMGIVPDESNLYPELTGIENLLFCAGIYGISEDKIYERAIELLEMVGLKDFKNRKFKAYSKGMKRKLTIIAGVLHKPKILFLDEPTTGIDVMSAINIRNFLKRINDEKVTIFMTTHYLEEAQRLSDRIGFIKKGKLIKVDSFQNLAKNYYKHPIYKISLEKDFGKEVFNNINGLKLISQKNSTYQVEINHEVSLFSVLENINKQNINILSAQKLEPTLEEIFVSISTFGE